MSRTILFVDDEESILKAIKRELFDAEFEVLTANSAEQGINIIDENKVDIVVSDVKMPKLDGIEFLKIIKEKHPQINRVILSGYVEEEVVFIAILQGIATTYFVKPWKPEDLRKKLEHLLQMQELFKNKKLLNILNIIKELPVLPKVYSELLKAIGKKKTNKIIAEIIAEDVSVSTKILQVVNSAFYGIKQVSSVERGIVLLGLNNIKDMVLTLAMVSELKWNGFQKRILEDIIFHSLLVNNIFKILYKKKFNRNLQEEFSSIGITHNIGKIVLLQYFPDEYKKIIEYADKHPDKTFFECESEINIDGVSHTQIGAYLLNLWNLHTINVEAALYHHEPDKCSEDNKEILRIFNLAIRIIEEVELMKKKPENYSIDIKKFTDNGFSKEDIEEIIKIIIESEEKK